MNRKLFILCLSIMLVLAIATFSFAATKARTASTAQGISEVVGIADIGDGNTVDVDADGRLISGDLRQTIYSNTGTTLLAGVQVSTGTNYVSSITISGPDTSAGDYILVYDNTSASGTPKFEITAGTAKDTNTIVIPGGATFSTGIYMKSNRIAVFGTITYD